MGYDIFVKTFDGNTLTFSTLTPADDISVIKVLIEERTGIKVGDQRLIYAGTNIRCRI
jgi:hypothetical protein